MLHFTRIYIIYMYIYVSDIVVVIVVVVVIESSVLLSTFFNNCFSFFSFCQFAFIFAKECEYERKEWSW